MIKKYIISTILFLGVLSCSDDEARPEVIKKLRAFGVSYDPFISSGVKEGETSVANSKIYVVSDSDQEVSIIVSEDERILGNLFLQSTLDEASRVLENDGKLKVYSYAAQAILPSESQVVFLPESPFMTFNTGYELTQGSEVEKIVSRYVIHPSTSDEVTWLATPPQVAITSLAEGDVVKKEDLSLKAEISNRNGETYKVSWYVSSGKVLNRRSIDTKWKEVTSGEQTVVVAIHGKKTAAFSWQAINITVE